MRLAVAIAGCLAGPGCGLPATFVCASHGECARGDVDGVCEENGYCSFADDTCPSQRRFGGFSPPALANECVPLDDTGTTSSSGAPDLDTSASTSSSTRSAGETATTSSTTADETTGLSEDTTGSSTGGPPEPDPDLILWLTFDDPRDPLADSSVYGRTVTCAEPECPSIAAEGPSSNAAVFDGEDDVLEIPNDAALDTETAVTVAFFVRNDLLSDLSITSVVALPYGMETENSWEFYFVDEDDDGNNDIVLEVADIDGQVRLVVPPLASKAEWQHVAAVWSRDTVRLYLDGDLQASAAATQLLFDDSPVLVGADRDGDIVRHFFRGAFDDIRIYRRALDEAELAALQ